MSSLGDVGDNTRNHPTGFDPVFERFVSLAGSATVSGKGHSRFTHTPLNTINCCMYSRRCLKAQTGDPNTTRSYSETSVDDGPILVFLLLLAILQDTRKRVIRV